MPQASHAADSARLSAVQELRAELDRRAEADSDAERELAAARAVAAELADAERVATVRSKACPALNSCAKQDFVCEHLVVSKRCSEVLTQMICTNKHVYGPLDSVSRFAAARTIVCTRSQRALLQVLIARTGIPRHGVEGRACKCADSSSLDSHSERQKGMLVLCGVGADRRGRTAYDGAGAGAARGRHGSAGAKRGR